MSEMTVRSHTTPNFTPELFQFPAAVHTIRADFTKNEISSGLGTLLFSAVDRHTELVKISGALVFKTRGIFCQALYNQRLAEELVSRPKLISPGYL